MNAIAQTGNPFINGTFETTEDANRNLRQLHYISGGDGLFAIYVIDQAGKATMYYIHTDYQGSFETITNHKGTAVEKLSFDPWGRRRNPTNWTFTNVPEIYLFDRGYTGHQRLDQFGLINMNGRMYDPMLGRFLSPDNYVQAPDYTQNFNRYSYVLNNPLKYTDPSGEFIQFIIGGIIGGVSGYMIGKSAGLKGWALVGTTLGGVVIGAGTAGIGTAISSSVAGAGGTILAGSTAGAAGTASFSSMTALANGGNISDIGSAHIDGIWKGTLTGLVGSSVGGAIGGGWGAIAGGATAGGVGTAFNGGSITDIILGAGLGGAMGWGYYHASLAFSYHVSGIKGTGLKYNRYAGMMRLTQRSMFWNREGKYIPNSEGGVNFSNLGTRNSTHSTGLDDYTDALFEYHTHQEFGYDHFSTAQESVDAYGVPDYSDEFTRTRLNLAPYRFKGPMYLGTREGHFLYMNSDFSRGYYTQYNFSHIFTPFNLTWTLSLIR